MRAIHRVRARHFRPKLRPIGENSRAIGERHKGRSVGQDGLHHTNGPVAMCRRRTVSANYVKDFEEASNLSLLCVNCN